MFHLIRPVTSVAALAASASKISGKPRAIYLRTAGAPVLTFDDGSTMTCTDLAVGVWHGMEYTHCTNLGGATGYVGY